MRRVATSVGGVALMAMAGPRPMPSSSIVHVAARRQLTGVTPFQQVCAFLEALDTPNPTSPTSATDLRVVREALRTVIGPAAFDVATTETPEGTTTTTDTVAAAHAKIAAYLNAARAERSAATNATATSPNDINRGVASSAKSTPTLFLLRADPDQSTVSIFYVAARSIILEGLKLADLASNPELGWSIASQVTTAGGGDLTAAFIDVSAADPARSSAMVAQLLRALSDTGLNCWASHITDLIGSMTRADLSVVKGIVQGAVSITTAAAPLRTLPDPWADGDRSAVFSRTLAVLLASNRLRVKFSGYRATANDTQQLADLVAPSFPIFVISLRKKQQGNHMSLFDIRTQRRIDCRGEMEELLRVLMEQTTMGPIGLLYGYCDTGLLFTLCSTLLRAQRLAITMRTGDVRKEFIGAAPSNNPETYAQNLVKCMLEGGVTTYSSDALIHDSVRTLAKHLRDFVGDVRQRSDAGKVLKAARDAAAAAASATNDAAEAEPGSNEDTVTAVMDREASTAMAKAVAEEDDVAIPIAQWLDPIYANPARHASETAALEDLKDYLVVAYSRSNITALQRPGNPNSPANHVTLLACRDCDGVTLQPTTYGVRRGDVGLPSLDGYSVLVTHHAKDLLLLLAGDKELQRFLQRGGRIWCTSVAEFVISAFQAKSPETTLAILAATYGAVGVIPDQFGEPPATSAPFDTLRAPTLRAATDEERQLHAHGAAVIASVFEGQKARAVNNRQLVALKLRLDSLLAFVEIERNGLMVRSDLVLTQRDEQSLSMAEIDAKLAKYVPAKLPEEMRRRWSWKSYQNLALYFIGGRVQSFEAPNARDVERCTAATAALYVRLVWKAKLLDKFEHNPALLAYCKSQRITEANPSNPKLLKTLAADDAKQTYRIVIFDLETTGLDPERDGIVEMCFFDPVAELKFSTLVNPERPISPEATRVNQISDDMVADAPKFADVAEELWRFLGLTPDTKKANETVILMAHGAGSLDVPLLRRQLAEAGVLTPSSARQPVFCDTLALLKAHRNQQRALKRYRDLSTNSLRLNELKHRHGIRVSKEHAMAHRAVADSLVLWEVLAHVFETEEKGSVERAEKLLQMMGRSVASAAVNCFAAAEGETVAGQAQRRMITIEGELSRLYGPEEVEGIADNIKARNWDPTVFEDLERAGSTVAGLLLKKVKVERLSTAFLQVDRLTNTPLYIHPDGLIRQDVKLTTATTGRTASSTPNCQNIPKSDKSEVRRIFVSRFGPEEGLCVEIDYAQLEVNVMALLSQDKGMIADLARGVDFHIKRVESITGRPYAELKALHKQGDKEVSQLRQNAKIMSFQRMYGGGVELLAKTTGLDRLVVKRMIAAEEREYPGIPRFHRLIRALCFRDDNPGLPTRYIAEMPNGCRVSFNPSDALNNMPPMKNYPVQAYGAEVVQAAMGILARQLLKSNNYGGNALLVNFVHDSVWFDCRRDVAPQLIADASKALSSVRTVLEDHFPGIASGVDFNVTVSVGKDMYDMKSPEKFFATKP